MLKNIIRSLVIFIALVSISAQTPDCNGFEETQCTDADKDGFFTEQYCGDIIDCNDEDPDNWVSCDTCQDADGDSYYVGCDVLESPDCNDEDPAINPGAIEEYCDDIDSDCDEDPDPTTEMTDCAPSEICGTNCTIYYDSCEFEKACVEETNIEYCLCYDLPPGVSCCIFDVPGF
jgi:putative metal-binding protein